MELEELSKRFLVDGDGDVVVGSGEGAAAGFAPDDARAHTADAGDRHGDAPIALRPLPYPEIRAAIAARLRGHLELEVGGVRRLAAISPVDALGWWYVVIADQDALLEGPGVPSS